MKELIEQANKDRIQRHVVGAVIIQDNKFLLLKRKTDDFMPGIFELPSGKVENAETFEQALKREIKEETNLELKEIIRYINYFDYLSGSGKRTREFNFLVNAEGKVKVSEHETFTWLSKQDLDNYNITENVKKTLRAV